MQERRKQLERAEETNGLGERGENKKKKKKGKVQKEKDQNKLL